MSPKKKSELDLEFVLGGKEEDLLFVPLRKQNIKRRGHPEGAVAILYVFDNIDPAREWAGDPDAPVLAFKRTPKEEQNGNHTKGGIGGD
jgi:hypothetical protein